jgi:hypothetical protein
MVQAQPSTAKEESGREGAPAPAHRHENMVLLWISIPFMIVGAAIAVAPVVLQSVREHRRIHEEAYASGALQSPRDGAARIALVAKPGVQATQLVAAFADSHSSADGPLFTGASVRRTAGERRVLVTVPAPAVQARRDLVTRIEEHLRSTDLFDEVRVLQAA